MARDPYAVLGIARTATLAQAEDAYLRRMRLEHPDVHHLAGPERVAEAEQISRDLTGAIYAIRAERAVRADVGAPAGAATADPPPGEPAPDGRVGDDGWDRAGSWDGAAGAWRPPNRPREPTIASCPWCGREFVHAMELKDHVFDDHDLRLDRRQRRSLLGGRVARLGRKASHLPLWGVIPINVLAATLIGVLADATAGDLVGWWAAGIAMAPTVVVLIDRASDIRL